MKENSVFITRKQLRADGRTDKWTQLPIETHKRIQKEERSALVADELGFCSFFCTFMFFNHVFLSFFKLRTSGEYVYEKIGGTDFFSPMGKILLSNFKKPPLRRRFNFAYFFLPHRQPRLISIRAFKCDFISLNSRFLTSEHHRFYTCIQGFPPYFKISGIFGGFRHVRLALKFQAY